MSPRSNFWDSMASFLDSIKETDLLTVEENPWTGCEAEIRDETLSTYEIFAGYKHIVRTCHD